MTRCCQLFATILALLITISAAPHLQAQDLNIYMTASSEVVGPGDRTAYMLTTTNTGAVDLTDVSVEVQLPSHINTFSRPPEFVCPSGICSADKTIIWDVGMLAPGQSQSVFYRVQISEDAPAETITSAAVASATGASDASTSLDVEIHDSPLVRLSLAPDSGPVVAGEPFTYTLTFGNVGTTSPSNVVLTMPAPDGSSFVSATGGGTVSDGTVTWKLGTLGVGAGGQVQVTVTPDASLGDGAVLEATAELNPNVATEPVARSSAVTSVRSGIPLRVEYAVSQTTVEPTGQLTYTLTATNTGAVDLTGVEARLLLPGFITSLRDRPPAFMCSSGICSANKAITWAVGTLAPGQSRTVFYRTFAADDAPQGEVLRSVVTASASSTGPVTAGLDLHVDPSPLLRLSLAPGSGPATPGEAFTYTLTIGNVGSNNPTSLTLQMPVPEGATFLSATSGGAESDGIVSWNIGVLGVGNSRELRLTVLPDGDLPDGSLLTARAELHPGVATESVVRSLAVTPVRAERPLRVEYAISQTTLGQGDALDVTLTATNSGAVDLTDVAARVLLPGFITSLRDRPPAFMCSSGICSANKAITWSVGTLAPGQSRTAFFRVHIADDAPQGEVSRSMLVATSTSTGEVSATQDFAVDPTPLLRLSIAPDPGPAVAGEEFTYTLTIGNVGSSNPSNVVLSMTLPEGTSFVSADDGGILQDGVVVWDIGNRLSVGAGAQTQVNVAIDASLGDGSVLKARVELDPGDPNEATVRSSAVTTVRAGVPLQVEYTVSQSAAAPGEQLTYTLIATNTGTVDLTGVEARLLLPGFITSLRDRPSAFMCSSGICSANKAITWAVGTLAPGQSQSVAFEPTVNSDAQVGEILRSLVAATGTGSNEIVLQQDVLIGTEVDFPAANEPPTAPVITSPEDGVRILIGGAPGEPPASPDSAFVVTWNGALDPEGDNLIYRWQLSPSPDFSTLLVDAEAARATLWYETDFGTLAALLADNGVEIGDSLRLYHRVVVSDFVSVTPSEPFNIILTRGTIVSSDDGAGLSTVFALHGNYPNPFGQSTTFVFELPEPAHVTLRVFDLLGREVNTILSGPLPAGAFEHAWEADALAAGIYVYRLNAGTFTASERLVVLR